MNLTSLKKWSTTPKNLAYILTIIAFSVFSAVRNVHFLFVAILLLWGAMVVYALSDLKNRSAYFIFLIAFALFLLGGEFFELYFGYKQEYTFDDKYDIQAYICLFISLFFLQAGFSITNFLQNKKATLKDCRPNYKISNVDSIRRITKIGLYLCVIPYLVTILDAGLYSLEHGYLSYYTDYSSRVPEIVEMISDLFPMFLFFFLATLPPKKECILPMLFYLVHGALAILTGRRIMIGVSILVLCAYIIFRHFTNKNEKWLNKKKVALAIIACPVLLVSLYAFRYIRYGQAIEDNAGVLDMICKFLTQQGSSISILKFQSAWAGEDELGCTSLYYTLHYLRGNFLTRGLLDFPLEYYAQRTTETALYTNCLADYIMHRLSPSDFFAGYGLGTSYIAELNHDLGYFGIALGSTIYGFLLNFLYSAKHFSFWKLSFGLMILEEFTILPRYGADVILRPFYNLTKLFVMTLLIAYFLIGKDNIKKLYNKHFKKGIDTMLGKLKKYISTRSVMLNTPPMGEIRHVTDEEVRELQVVMLQMIKDVAEVCKKHGICYMADGGTALGSVRHKGFIPWDDDVDLIMPRDDLNKFVEVFDEELGDKYELVTPNSKGHKVASLITEIYAKGTYKSSLHNMDNDLPQGVMIDIFPLEYAPTNPIVRRIKGTVALMLQYIAVSATFYNLYNTPTKKKFFYQTKEGKFNYNFRRLIGFFFSFRSYDKWCNTFDKFVRGKKDTGLWCIPTDVGHYFGHLMPKEIFYPPITGTFEDMEINLPNNIHEYLVNAYGDYMWVPPVEQREKHWTVGFDMHRSVEEVKKAQGQ